MTIGISLGRGIYSARLTAKLAGVSLRQLRYWVSKELIGPSAYDAPYRGRDLFAYVDIVQARVIGRLRDRGLSLQRITKALAWLRKEMRAHSDWHTKTIVTDGVDVFVMLGQSELETYSAVRQPGQGVIVVSLGEIAEDLLRAGQLIGLGDKIDTDPAILGGTPVIRNTRISTSLVHQLLAEGVTPAEVVRMYPSVDADGVRAAEEFELQLAAV